MWIHVLLVFWLVAGIVARGRCYALAARASAALEAAKAKGEITSELRTALNDPAVNAARAYELIMVGVITGLMVTRSF